MAAKQACMAAELLMTHFLYPYHWTPDVKVGTHIHSMQQGNIATNDGAFYAQPDVCAMPLICIPWDFYGGSMMLTTFKDITKSVHE